MPAHRAKRIFSLIASALAALLTPALCGLAGAQQSDPAGPEVASRGQRGLVRPVNYGDWQKVCFRTPASNMTCRTTISGTFDTGQTAVRADLIEREGEGKARLRLFLPVGLYLQAGVRLTVDQGNAYQVPYVRCMTNACIAGNPADPQLVSDMEKGEKLVLEVVDSSVQTINTELPLGHFAAARNAAPAQTFEQDGDE